MKKIDQVVILNFKKHEKYEGKFNGKHFVLFGLNGAGKSSILDAIKRTIGQKAKLLEPITQGKDGATISTYLVNDKEKYCLEEKFSKASGKSRLKFYRVNGSHRDELNPPLERFYEIFGKPIDFTPLIDMEGKDQFEYLKNNLGFDISMYEHNYDSVYSTRTIIGQTIESLKGQLNSPDLRVVQADIDTYNEEKSATDILGKKIDLEPLLAQKTAAATRDANIKTVQEKEAQLDKEIKDLELRLISLKESKANCEEWYKTHPPIETDQIEQQISEARKFNAEIDQQLIDLGEWNKNVTKVQNFVKATKSLEEKKAEYKEKTDELKEIEAKLNKALTEIPLSTIVENLELMYVNTTEINDKGKEVKVKKVGLMLENLPFNRSQHSYGKLLKAVIKLAAHFNADKLNFISIGDWNLLDPDSQQEVLDFAANNPDLNVQFGIEKVDSHKEVMTELIER